MKLIRSQNHPLPTGVLGLAPRANGNHAFVSCIDGSVHEVDLTTGKTEPFAGKHTSFASSCVLLPGERTLISAGYDGQLLWHDTATRQCWRRVQAHSFWSWQTALSPDGRCLATGCDDGSVVERIVSGPRYAALSALDTWPGSHVRAGDSTVKLGLVTRLRGSVAS